jgi:catechol 2,3-dioxygenase-like lactoylglutathione lyase family enzyme
MSQEASDLFTRLAPVLNVCDLAAERAFYELLGLPVIYEGPEYPEFIGFGTETVHFGIQKAATDDNDPPSVLPWQIGVTDIEPPWSDAAPQTSASNSNTTTPAPGGPTGACSSVPRAAIGWHSKVPTNDCAEPVDSRPGLQFRLQFAMVRSGSDGWAVQQRGAATTLTLVDSQRSPKAALACLNDLQRPR